MTAHTPVHARRNLERLATSHRRNLESTSTEEIDRLQEGFRYAPNAADWWQAENLSLMYGSPLWEQASQAQRLALNHLWWVAWYHLVSGLELHTIEYNGLCAQTFFRLDGYSQVCLELDLETSQERHHIQAFRAVGEATEEALLGFRLFLDDQHRPRPTLLSQMHDHVSAARGALMSAVSRYFGDRVRGSPFLASQYYLLRGLFNQLAKHKEATGYQRYLNAQREGVAAPAPLAITYHHYIDEGYHMATSSLLGHEIYLDFPRPSAAEVLAVNVTASLIQRALYSHPGALMAGTLGDDAPALPLMYRILRSRLFGLDHAETMRLLERSYCVEHEGYHASMAYHARFREAARRSFDGVEHMWAKNRELSEMTCTLEGVLAENRRTYATFARAMAQQPST